MTLHLKTPPTVFPYTLAEAKLHLKVDVTDDDALIQGYIDAAVSLIDGTKGLLGRALLSQVWELYLDAFPSSGFIKIPFGQILSIDSVDYLSPLNGIYINFVNSNYRTDIYSEFGWVALATSASWPVPMVTMNAVRVTFTAGYGSLASDVPPAIKQAIRMTVAHWYELRGIVITDKKMEEIPFGPRAMLEQFKRVGI